MSLSSVSASGMDVDCRRRMLLLGEKTLKLAELEQDDASATAAADIIRTNVPGSAIAPEYANRLLYDAQMKNDPIAASADISFVETLQMPQSVLSPDRAPDFAAMNGPASENPGSMGSNTLSAALYGTAPAAVASAGSIPAAGAPLTADAPASKPSLVPAALGFTAVGSTAAFPMAQQPKTPPDGMLGATLLPGMSAAPQPATVAPGTVAPTPPYSATLQGYAQPQPAIPTTQIA